MPELPEVEAARERLERLAKGKRISHVSAEEDSIVFSGVTHASFATAIEGKTVREVRRKGKQFYMVLESGPHPLFHFGMSGYSQTKGISAPTYKVPRAKSDPDEWPPKYMKTTITFADEDGTKVGEWAFCDARRLGRIKLIETEIPEEAQVLTCLGQDPLLDMISIEALATALGKRHAPIKAVLLDQNGPICGLGNWMVDEICYQSKIHPAHPSSALAPEEVTTLHTQILLVTTLAVEAKADAARFPKSWLFSARWGKGKKGKDTFVLPSGEETPLTFVTVGGRTSAVVTAVQKLPEGLSIKSRKRKATDEAAKNEGEEESSVVESKQNPMLSPHFGRKKTLPVPPDASPSKSPATKFELPSLASPTKTEPEKMARPRKSKAAKLD
ncbi:formamidopyrimidine-DNA glycosylase, partial [Phenoliferia sp. Uapishka_3]